ncbi:HNH endonuclease signature motif containing protein [Fimbriiglobus ruber]|uniref:HNH endonuclease signature motif containing protein n=1 Tax=Fimbriiglobus ruber TaxID=1908690 RepID=UPI000B4AEA44|nr:HNH endonuclease signature motif containing protein [Fimbriiglobus ruber]
MTEKKTVPGYNIVNGKKGCQSIPFTERLISKIIRCKGTGCWIWQGASTTLGYGQIWKKGKNILAHRAVFEMFKYAVPKGFELDHLCRNKSCVNPQHLEVVTHSENLLRAMRHKKARAAIAKARGENAELAV